jgi:hypothetical protein
MKKRKRRHYTQEFKEEAVKLITEQGYSFAEAGINLGVSPIPAADIIPHSKKILKKDTRLKFIYSLYIFS